MKFKNKKVTIMGLGLLEGGKGTAKFFCQQGAKVLITDLKTKEQLKDRRKFPLTGLDIYFSSIETNIAFKEELLKSSKDLDDAKHLRIVYKEEINEDKINEIKQKIRKFRLKK